MKSSLYEDAGEDFDESSPVSPLFSKVHKVPPFDPSPARDEDIRRCLAACAQGRETITPAGARQWAEIEERRLKYLDYRQRAKRRKAAGRAT